MTKQEAIRKGIEQYARYPSALLDYLDSQGVAIKCEGEWPENPWIKADYDPYVLHTPERLHTYHDAQQDMLKAGYTKWKSLVEE